MVQNAQDYLELEQYMIAASSVSSALQNKLAQRTQWKWMTAVECWT